MMLKVGRRPETLPWDYGDTFASCCFSAALSPAGCHPWAHGLGPCWQSQHPPSIARLRSLRRPAHLRPASWPVPAAAPWPRRRCGTVAAVAARVCRRPDSGCHAWGWGVAPPPSAELGRGRGRDCSREAAAAVTSRRGSSSWCCRAAVPAPAARRRRRRVPWCSATRRSCRSWRGAAATTPPRRRR